MEVGLNFSFGRSHLANYIMFKPLGFYYGDGMLAFAMKGLRNSSEASRIAFIYFCLPFYWVELAI